MPGSISNSLLYFTGATLALGLLLFLVSLRLFRRSRTDVFWRRRREAGQRGWRLFLVAFLLFIVGGVSCVTTLALMLLSDDTDTATETTNTASSGVTPPEYSPTAAETIASTPIPPEVTVDTTPTAIIITATPAHTPTETPFPTFTPNVTPLISTVTPHPMAEIMIVGLDDQISDDLMPIDPRTSFEAGITRLYMFVAFRNMTQGVLWHRNLYQDGELIDSNSYLWGLETEGNSYFFFGSDNGFEPGTYEIRVFIGNNLDPVSTTQFTITETPES